VFTGRYGVIAAGDYQSAGHTEPFGALASLALHAVKRGVGEDDFAAAAWRAGVAVRRRSRTRPAGEIVARKAHHQAVTFAASHARGGSQRALIRWVESSALWLHRFRGAQWRGRGSSAERKVLAALTERALKAHDLCVNASVRLLEAETLLPRSTVAAALHRLEGAGWVRLSAVPGGAQMASLLTDGVDVFDALESVYSSAHGLDVSEPVASETSQVVFAEVFARKTLNRHHGFVVAAGVAGVTTRQVASGQGLTMVTARRHLHDLAAAGLVARAGRVWVATDVPLDAVAADPGLPGVPTAGLRERIRAAHVRERWSYSEHLVDTHARKPQLRYTPSWESIRQPAHRARRAHSTPNSRACTAATTAPSPAT
jgi:DNA-binding MarR family transcriptional regulator